MITYLGIKAKSRPKKYKKASYTIVNVSKKDLSKIIRDLEKLFYKSYEKKRAKHEPTDSYFYLARHLANCTMRADALNSKVYPVIMEMNAKKHIPTSDVCSTEKTN